MTPTIEFKPKPNLPPPIATVGMVGWLRSNLLSSPFNILLTLVGLLVLYQTIPPMLQWLFFDATLDGNESAICKVTNSDGDIVDAPGACWTFIKIRFLQIMFGLYYSANVEQVWRPTLMLALVAVQIGLFFVPVFRWKRQLGVFATLIYPFIGFALIHGEWLGLPVADTDQWGGFLLTFILASIGIVAALPIGILLALGRRSRLPVVRVISVTFIEFWRGTPLITILFMASVMLPLFFPSGVDFDKVARALIGITLFQSAYTAEAIRGGLQAISRGQYEAADALGISYWKKNIFIILPQALKISIPGIVNTFLELFKDTSLVAIIGLFDLLNMAQAASRSSQWKGYDLEAYVFSALIFFICCYGMSKYSQSLERKLETEHKKQRA